MDFKKLASGAETLFNRAKQFTEEKLGSTEKTEFDPNLVTLVEKADKTKTWIEKIIRNTQAYLQPNQAARLEDFLSEKLQAYKPGRQAEQDTFAQGLIDASVDLGSTTPFGVTLNKCGEAGLKLAEAWRTFSLKVVEEFVTPFKSFLDEDMAAFTKERKTLETKRLDLDVAKGKYKKVTTPGKEPDPSILAKVEEELKVAQDEFDKQVELTQGLLEALTTRQADHVGYMKAFQAAQAAYFRECAEIAKDAD